MNTAGEYRMQLDVTHTLEATRDMRGLLHDVVDVLTTLVDEIKTLKVVTPEIETAKETQASLVAEAIRAIGEDWHNRTMTVYAAAKVLETEVEHLRAENVELKAEIYALWQTDHEMEFGGEG